MIDIIDYAVDDEKDAEGLRGLMDKKVRKDSQKSTNGRYRRKKGERRKHTTISDHSKMPRMWK